MNDLKIHIHAHGHMTELLAYEKARKGSPSVKHKILHEVEQAGDVGITPDEFVEMHGGLINTIRRRFTDLWKEGKIRHHPLGVTRKNPAGNACVTWVMGRDPQVLPNAPRPRQQAQKGDYIEGFDAGCSFLRHCIQTYISEADPQDTAALARLAHYLDRM